MKQLADDSGFDVLASMRLIPLPLSRRHRRGRSLSFLHFFNWGLTRLRSTLFGYQFILICQPKA